MNAPPRYEQHVHPHLLLTAAEMRAFDSERIAAGTPSLLLMENAGRAAADAIVADLAARHGASFCKKIVVLAGAGNNGGDGYVVARRLRTLGWDATVFALAPPATPEAATMKQALVAIAPEALVVRDPPDLDDAVVVDALFGVGLTRPLVDHAAALVTAVNAARQRSTTRVYSLDIPSGIDADTGEVRGVAVEADVTVAFAFAKRGAYTPRGAAHSGRRLVVDIGVPCSLLAPAVAASAPRLDDASTIAALLPRRSPEAHKYTAGHVLVVGGAVGKSGALLLAGDGAFGAGAGLVTLACPEEARLALEYRVKEAMTAPWNAPESVLFAKKKVCVIGPGFGLSSAAEQRFEALLAGWPAHAPLVLDADALTLVAGSTRLAARAPGSTILTPHSAEAARLLGTSAASVDADRFGAVAALVEKTGAVVVLKGAHTLVGAPCTGPSQAPGTAPGTATGISVHVATTGNPALATGGSGDVLAGAIGALAGALAPRDAARVAVHLHGAAADRWVAANGAVGLRASALADGLAAARGALEAIAAGGR